MLKIQFMVEMRSHEMQEKARLSQPQIDRT